MLTSPSRVGTLLPKNWPRAPRPPTAASACSAAAVGPEHQGFNPAVQLTTTVIGGSQPSMPAATRKRCPSAVTS